MPFTAKDAIKEGGKKGQDLNGVSAMGGVQYFNMAMETPEGDMELLEKVLEGLNAPVDEAAEERKGGAGDIGKFIHSAGESVLVSICHVPKELSDAKALTAQEWVDEVVKALPKAVVTKVSDEVFKIVTPADTDNNVFPLKVRDAAIDIGFKLLKTKGLVPSNADDSDDDVNYAEAAGVEW